MERSTRLDLPLLLPEIEDLRDTCIARLVRLLERRDGVQSVHVVRPGEVVPDEPRMHDGSAPAPSAEPQLCLHYDPERLTLAQVTALARAAGADVTVMVAEESAVDRTPLSPREAVALIRQLRIATGGKGLSPEEAAAEVRVLRDEWD